MLVTKSFASRGDQRSARGALPPITSRACGSVWPPRIGVPGRWPMDSPGRPSSRPSDSSSPVPWLPTTSDAPGDRERSRVRQAPRAARPPVRRPARAPGPCSPPSRRRGGGSPRTPPPARWRTPAPRGSGAPRPSVRRGSTPPSPRHAPPPAAARRPARLHVASAEGPSPPGNRVTSPVAGIDPGQRVGGGGGRPEQSPARTSCVQSAKASVVHQREPHLGARALPLHRESHGHLGGLRGKVRSPGSRA